MPSALIVEDDPSFLSAIAEIVTREGFETRTADSLERARERLGEATPDLLLLDLHLPDGAGLDLLAALEPENQPAIVLMTAQASVETAIEAFRRGASDYLTKPLDLPRLKMILANISRTRDLKAEITTLRTKLRRLGRYGRLLGTSPAMQIVYDALGRVAPTDATILLTGETGTGKEVVAQTVHEMSRRARSQFVPIDCGAIAPQLIESELFGHERGSFTGADRMRQGLFERANGGTVLLDEITEMSIDLQVKLLRVIESSTVQRVGGSEILPVDVRIIAASNRMPQEAVAAGKLREDLYYRLHVFPIVLPPLRDRKGDVQLLAKHFLEEQNSKDGLERRFSDAALERLVGHSWPGNVRELRNVVQRASILGQDELGPETIRLGDGKVQMAGSPAGAAPAPTMGALAHGSGNRNDGTATATAPAPATNGAFTVSPGSRLYDVERDLILSTLASFEGNKKKTADALGISLKTLYVRIREYKVR